MEEKKRISVVFENWYAKEITTYTLKKKLAQIMSNVEYKNTITVRAYIDFLIASYRLKTCYEKEGVLVIFEKEEEQEVEERCPL